MTAKISSLGLSVDAVERHARALRQAVASGTRPCFKIVDTCRKDNGGILPQDVLAQTAVTTAPGAGFVAFVPAAGAASRYSQPLFQLESALEDEGTSGEELALRIAALRAEGAIDWPLPPAVHHLLASPSRALDLDAVERRALLADLQLPKALMPCVKEGASFVSMKLAEHKALPGLAGQVFVARAGMAKEFCQALENAPDALVLEQGPLLSTLRFTPDVLPYVEPDGGLSPVPAGHGALVGLFADVRRRFSDAHSLFVRNIDNVIGTKPEAVSATTRFLKTHRRILEGVRDIRKALAADRIDAAAAGARALLSDLGVSMDAATSSLHVLTSLQQRIFHARLDKPADLAVLRALYDRPVNTLGQVPNLGTDVGGTPCFVEVRGAREKICIEVPHVDEADKRRFLADPTRATHFNPGFVAAEMPADDDYYGARNQDFWLLAEKTYRGAPVLYFETVIYELLGNSRLANCVFLEVPRLVFNPHKTLKDAVGKGLADWAG